MASLASDSIPLLKKLLFFSTFGQEEISALVRAMATFSLPKGAVLFRQGDPGDALYVVRSGRVRLVRQDRDQEKLIGYAGRGEALGEMSLLTGEPRSATAWVDGTAEFLVLYRKDFEQLVRQMPSMAVHLASLLSRRLLETTQENGSRAAASRIYAVTSHLSLPDRLVFTANLAMSLVEQTRRKVLLLDLSDQDTGLCGVSLGLAHVKVGESSLRQEDLQSPAILQRLTVYHPSGLELISIPFRLIEGKLFPSLYPFLSLIREKYDLTLLMLPPGLSPAVQAILEECNSVLYVEKEDLKPEDTQTLSDIAALLPEERLRRVQLAPEPRAFHAGGAGFVLPWRPTLARECMESKSVFLAPRAPVTQRMMDRLARLLGGLRIGLAMGSGAAYGYSLIGMLRVMERNGLYPDVISGTSIGALIGSFYAAGKTPDELEEIALSITKRKLLSMFLPDLTLPSQGLFLGREVLRFLKTVLGDRSFEDLSLPFACVATDIVTGDEVVLKDGKVADAVRASLSLPFFFQPLFHKGRYLVDGGLVNPVPTSVIASMGADVLISVNLTTRPAQKRIPMLAARRQRTSYWKGPNVFEVMLKTIYTMQFEIAQARSEIAHVVLDPDMSAFTWSEFYRAPEIIKVGEQYMEESLPKVKSLLPFYSDYCRLPARNNGAIQLRIAN
jgi:NTE family protein